MSGQPKETRIEIGLFVAPSITGLCVIYPGGSTLSEPAIPGVCVRYFKDEQGGLVREEEIIPAETTVIDHRNGQGK